MLIQPSQADVRRFFCAVYAKSRDGQPLEAIETIASLWIAEHPEYHEALGDVEAALRAMGTPDPTNANPFLHLSMHLSISEQCSIDQPRGIRQAVELLTHKRNSLHAAHHETMECLGQHGLGKPARRPSRPMATPTSTACSGAPRATEPSLSLASYSFRSKLSPLRAGEGRIGTKKSPPKRAGHRIRSCVQRKRDCGTVLRSPSSEAT
jgi:hypothetical protein